VTRDVLLTQSQGTVPVAAQPGTAAKATSMWRHLPSGPDQRVSTRVRTMWTGVGATLARDVPFSAIYWQLLEPTRRALLPTTDGAASSHSRVRCSKAHDRSAVVGSLGLRPDVLRSGTEYAAQCCRTVER